MIFKRMSNATKSIMEKIHHHPFNQELAGGILPKEKFIYYLVQDALYLLDFSKALALTAARLPNNDQAQQILQFSLEAVYAERDLHTHYLTKNNLSDLLNTEQNPACFMYTNYLLKTASLASVEEAVASLLPCFWVYREVGKNIALKQQANNPYEEWIALYSSKQFDLSVNAAINITTELGHAASDAIKDKMIAAFVRSTQLEWLFWQGAYHQEQWIIENEKNVFLQDALAS